MDVSYRTTLELDKIIARAVQLCTCAETKEMMRAIEPFATTEEERYALAQTNAINALLLKNGSPRFGAVHEVRRVVAHAAKGGILSMGELLEIAAALRNFSGLAQWYGLTDHDMLPTDDLFFALAPQPVLEKQIGECIISPEEMADTASVTLRDLRRKIRATEDSIRTKLDAIIKNSTTNKFLQDAVVSIRNGRYVVPVRAEYRGEVGGVIHDVSSTGSTVFVEPTAVVEANARIMQLHAQEQEEITRILTAFSGQVASLEPQFSYSYDAMLQIDLLLAKARLAVEQNAFMPQVNDSCRFALKKARHPLIDKKKVVPVDIALGEKYDTLVITGPNTGGKTVSIKTVGLLTLMAMCGLMIPVADQSRVSVFTHVLADIGDEQSIEQSLSTFSAHMTNIIGILRQADAHSLVLIDELGAGTDPVEGAALAMAILEQLHQQGAKIAATTHYAELKAYALQTPRVENGCCEFDVTTLRPTYRLLIGVPGRSNAFAISERLGMETAVVDRARELVSAENTRFEDVVESLEKSHQALEQERADARAQRAEAEAIRQKAEEQLKSVDQLREREMEQARAQAVRIVEQARRESQAFLMELEKLKKEKEKNQNLAELARRAKSQMKQHANAMAEVTNPVVAPVADDADYVLPRPLRVGDAVLIADLNRQAVVLTLPDKNGNVEVQAGPLKTRVRLQNLRLLNAKERKQQAKGRTVRRSDSIAQTSVKTSCDLRGKTVEEALLDLDQFLDDCVMTGLNECTIIHGKGTGALRGAVQKHLRAHPMVKSYRLGVYGEGEDGVTMVTLK